jgi:hypothetical protein
MGIFRSVDPARSGGLARIAGKNPALPDHIGHFHRSGRLRLALRLLSHLPATASARWAIPVTA